MSNSNGKHIMFSYAWNGGHHEKIDHIAKKFQEAGIPIWMDVSNGLGPNLNDGMAKAVEQSHAVCYFLTPQYQESKCCKKELQYADELNIPIIPCYLIKFQPRDWLGLLTAGRIHYDLSNDSYNTVLNEIIRYIKQDILKLNQQISSKHPPAPIDRESASRGIERIISQKCAVGAQYSNEQNSSPEKLPAPDAFLSKNLPMPSTNVQQISVGHDHVGRQTLFNGTRRQRPKTAIGSLDRRKDRFDEQ